MERRWQGVGRGVALAYNPLMSEPAISPDRFYVTTPIYYVNDRPHVGHCYSTLLADTVARFMRASGRDVFFLTGTDEHSERVASRAAEEGMTPIQWADRNAGLFKEAFAKLGFTNDDFIRTTESRHKDLVTRYVRTLLEQGDVYLGEYSGWWDHSQEEYLTETVAREHGFKSPVTGKDLVKRTEKNYFFRLARYQDRLLRHINENPGFIRPEARKNEVLGRLRDGLQDVPVSRGGAGDGGAAAWGIRMPGDEGHSIYVWIDALFNYLSVVDTRERRGYWPADVHLIAKDILWFHAVIWPCLLMALGEELPKCVYAHSFWIREGRKMSKSLGNFIDMETIDAYCDRYGTDALRWYLLTQGPMGATDADFSYAKFVEVYNADLANGIGNAASRVVNMIHKYFDGKCPPPPSDSDDNARPLPGRARDAAFRVSACMGENDIGGALQAALGLSNAVDVFINDTTPFKLAKDPANMERVGHILYDCVESIRIASVLLSCALPEKMGALLGMMGQPVPMDDGSFEEPMDSLCAWGRLKAGDAITKGEGLFPRADGADPEPGAR